MPIPSEPYCLCRTFWPVPWGSATAIKLGGIAHVLAVVGWQVEAHPRRLGSAWLCADVAARAPAGALGWGSALAPLGRDAASHDFAAAVADGDDGRRPEAHPRGEL